MATTEATAPQIELLPAEKHHEPILANLLELYAHDFSEFLDVQLGADGRFGYAHLPLYWQDANRHPFLISVDGSWAGFVLLTRGASISGTECTWDMAEFFIVRGYRRHQIGTRIAHEVWRLHPGPWQVRVMESNQPAYQFWGRAVEAFVGHAISPLRVSQDGKGWYVFLFESNPAA